ncbi:YecA family protein [Domibacillus iocasae]|uniref:Zinc chelation protein SecC n=1 Tax=Domibacillus iocasae TaxID=1714016 RepID=A0A1E7DQP6_9BACI|nr:SEC-C metal-binding domain-containing protein [Domibacillus iocasae]OES45383.1 zinc chelation protein SecC [Domibacillus iocasae]
MDILQIKKYLNTFRFSKLDPTIKERLTELKKIAVLSGDQEVAKEIWCLEQVYQIIQHYLKAFNLLKKKEYLKAWMQLDRADIEFSFLRKHFDYSGNKYNLEFLEKNIYQFQRLFPYQYFLSRESVTKKERCSICNQTVSIRKSCGHKVGEIYNGEQCSRIVEEIELLGFAIVKNPFDKYTVLMPQDIEYNYFMLENLLQSINHPYTKWNLEVQKEDDVRYKKLGRNANCICDSGIKFKKCCLNNEDRKIKVDHHKITVLDKVSKDIKPIPRTTFRTTKTKE